MLDYAKLCQPYVSAEWPGTPEGQRKWLVQSKRIPEDAADLAMAAVYARMDQGATFESGDALDQALLGEARELIRARVQAALEVGQAQIEGAATALYRQRTTALRPKQMVRHPLVALGWYRAQVVAYLLGAATVGGVWLWLR